MTDLNGTLIEVAARVSRRRQSQPRLNESNTRANLVDPVIAALGWDVHDSEEVHREYRRLPSSNPVDYALLLDGKPKLHIEAKGLGGNLRDPKWTTQFLSYASGDGVDWAVLTDGEEWRLYHAHASVPAEEKLVWSTKVTEIDAADKLVGLSKDNIREGLSAKVWKRTFTDRQVLAILGALFSGPNPSPDLSRLLGKSQEGLSKADLESSLRRVKATFSIPEQGNGNLQKVQVAPAPVGNAHGLSSPTAAVPPAESSSSSSSSRKRSTTKVADLIAQGRLRAGSLLEMDLLEEHHTAELMADGAIRYNGKVYRTPSDAASAVRRAIGGPDTSRTTVSINGWIKWFAKDEIQSDVVSLKTLQGRHNAAF